ncbi:HPP family protein [Kitasatospora sp. NPDC096147]|uniref:HPP family protein n=1 Tax=Kitasatospora sp. NPDC096147 TaxID=3364093 RepID=UPI003807A9E7
MSTDLPTALAGHRTEPRTEPNTEPTTGPGAGRRNEPRSEPGGGKPGTAARLRALTASRAPARPGPAAAAHTLASVTSVLLLLVGIGAAVHEPLLIPPLAATAALIHSVPGLPLAQPRSVIGGHLLCATVGLTVHAVLGSSLWAAAVAAGLALGTNMLARTPHSPACATAVIAVLQGPAPARFLVSLAPAVLLLVGAGVLAARLRPTAPAYPAYWW